MEYFDWIASTLVFILVFVTVITMIPDYIPTQNLEQDYLDHSNVYNSIVSSVDSLNIKNINDYNTHPYLLESDKNYVSDSFYFKDNNQIYTILSKESSLFNLTKTNDSKIKYLETNFKDNVFYDFFEVNSGDINLENNLVINSNSEIKLKKELNNYNLNIDFNSQELNVYFNYIDTNNHLFLEITDSLIILNQIKDNNSIELTRLDKQNIVNKNNLKLNIDQNSVFINLNDQNIENNFDLNNGGSLKLESRENNIKIYNLDIFLKNNLEKTNNYLKTKDYNLTVNNNIVDFSFLENDTNTSFTNILFNKDLNIYDSNTLGLLKDINNDTSLVLFPNLKEFWVNLDSNQDINLSLNNTFNIKSDYNYYIEDNDTNLNLWTKLDLEKNSTKTIYLYKQTGNLENPDNVFEFFDDFSNDTLDTNKWTHTGNNISFTSEDEIRIFADSNTSEDDKGIESNEEFGLNTILEVKFISEELTSTEILTHIGYGMYSGDQKYIALLDYSSGNHYVGFYRRDTDSNNTFLNETPFEYNKFIIKRIDESNLEMSYKNNSYLYNTQIPTTNLPILLGSFNPDGYLDFKTDYVFVRKYADSEPTTNVTKINNNIYKIDITNNNSYDLNNFQVKVSGADLEIIDQNTSLYLLDDYNKSTNNFILENKITNEFMKIFSKNKNNKNIECNYLLNDIGLNIKCENDSTLKIVSRNYNLDNYNYPKIIKNNNSKNYIKYDKLNNIDLNRFYINIENDYLKIEKGKEKLKSIIFKDYSNYLDQNLKTHKVKIEIK